MYWQSRSALRCTKRLFMDLILVISIVLRVIATIMAVVVWRRLRDWRIVWLLAMLVLMTLRQALTLASTMDSSLGWYPGSYTELPGLLVSGLALSAVFFLERIFSGHRETERRLAESNARVKRVLAQLEALYTDTPAGMAFFDLDLRYTRVNDVLAELNGLPVSEHPGKTVYDVIPDLAPYVETRLRQVVDTGRPILREEQAGRTRDDAGDPRTWLVDYYPVRLDTGEMIGIGVFMSDVTDLKQAEQRARDEKKRLQTLFDTTQDAILILDDTLRFLDVNPASCELFGWTREEAIQHTFYELIPVELRKAAAELERRFFDQGHVEGEFTLRRLDGQRVVVSYRIQSGLEPGVHFAVLRDITAAKRNEEALRESEMRLHRLLNSISEIVWSATPNGRRMQYISDSAEAIYGRPKAEFIDNPGLWFDCVHPDDRERVAAESRRLLDEGRVVSEYRIVRPDGSIRWILDRKRILRDAQGDPVQMGGIAEDITDRREAAKRLEQALQENRQQNQELSALLDISVKLASRVDLNSLFQAIVKIIVDTLPNAEAASLWLREEDSRRFNVVASHGHDPDVMRALSVDEEKSLIGLVLRERSVVYVGDTSTESAFEPVHPQLDRVRSVLGCPLILDDEPIGLLFVDSYSRTDAFEERDGRLLRSIAGQAVLAMQNARLFDELRTTSARLMQAEEEERRRIARELHDEIGGLLTSLQIKLKLSQNNAILPAPVDESVAMIAHIMQQVRSMSLDLRPSMLDDLGLIPALRWFVRRYIENTGIQVHIEHDLPDGVRFPAEVETAAYRIVQEALTNVARHANTKEARVTLHRRPDHLALTVVDNGRGFDVNRVLRENKSAGVLGMRERVLLLGGHFSVDAGPGRATRIEALLPLA